MCDYNILKFMLEPLYVSCRTSFHLGITHEHTSFSSVSHVWHFNIGNNMTEWISECLSYRSSNISLRRYEWVVP